MTIKHLLTGDELDKTDIENLLILAEKLKQNNLLYSDLLKNQHVSLVFEKPSLRTRLSFTVAINQLGGHAIESIAQTRKHEEPKDFIRVIQGLCSAMMIRTFKDSDLVEMAKYAKIPIINGLTDMFHPCQALADLFTIKEHFKTFENLKIAYIGDGNNVLHSLMMMATKLGIAIHYCCPQGYGPQEKALQIIENRALIKEFTVPQQAIKNCQVVYTDVWTSMGFEAKNEAEFAGYQVNEELMSHAATNAIFMHCMPMERGKEVGTTLPDAPCSVIFQQSENRMHVQKALLIHLLSKEN